MRSFLVQIVRLVFGLLFALAIVFPMQHRAAGLQELEVFPLRVPAGSPETLIHIFGFDFSDVRAVKLNGMAVPFATVGKVEINAMIPPDLIKQPGILIATLERSAGVSAFEP